MQPYKLGEMEQKFAEIIWQEAPVTSRRLTELCAEHFSWKRTTTYTMLKRLCERGLFQNQSGTVMALVSQEEFSAAQGQQFLNESFGGSMPKFVAAFARQKKLSAAEIAEIEQLIANYKE